jgi:FtsP/CotA-like multicopper oxidase with cupredoxin domain
LARASAGNLIVILAPLFTLAAAAQECPQLRPGAIVRDPVSISSSGGTLRADFVFRTSIDVYGLRHYCYVYNGDVISPTLRVRPGDELVLRLRNDLPPNGDLAAPGEPIWPHAHTMEVQGACGGGKLFAASTNLHFHGMQIAPACHQDDVLSTLVEPNGGSYEYRFRIPEDQPPGLYWYHPHSHGFSEAQVLGGASGALIVEGIERANPRTAQAFERLLVLRDQMLPGMEDASEDAGPARDVTLNWSPVLYPMNRAAKIVAQPERREFWRVLNAAADTYFDLQVRAAASMQETPYPVPIEIAALDGAPAPPQSATHVLIPPGGRAEFLVAMPAGNMFAQLVTLRYDTGPAGESTPYRVLADLEWSNRAPVTTPPPSTANVLTGPTLAGLRPVRQRKLYFSEIHRDPNDYASMATYYITVDGQKPRRFDMNFKRPNITVRQGTVEDWVVENRAPEAHNFHIHQLHFQVLERDGKPVREPALRDTIDLPFWDGKGPYPSLKLRMDFRNPRIVGTFVYHCHILEHEDGGMMGIIRVTKR